MQFIKNNFWTLFMVAVFALLGMSGDALAQSSAGSSSGATVMSLAASKGVNTFKAVRTIIFIVGGFGLVGVAFVAIFGKINWKWFASLAVGLGILAAAGSVVTYATGDTTTSRYGDTFSESSGSAIGDN
ncbi:MAG: hypothetical protein E7012_01980 [Alphaproteobacteria bacterium]|nr:hypothetical protein [Alphaproteobacteria bacterium]